jgi:cell volume regulation protein A
VFLVDRALLIGAGLLLLAVLSRKLAARSGVPMLLLFVGLGMLAGSDGPGGIHFEDYGLAHAVGTVALALILFDGGLRTPWRMVRRCWRPALSLATVGVLITAAATGIAAVWVLDVPLPVGLLLGCMVASTDAAAVLAVLRSSGVHLRPRLASTLEIESGTNDPMAIFLTVGLVQVLLGEREPGLEFLLLFVQQMGFGTVLGLGLGLASRWVVQRIDLDVAGLYPMVVGACGLLTFGLTAAAGGSGFLAIYLAGLVLGNGPLVFRRGVLQFLDSTAWFAQIAMFLVLGLLCFPSRLAEVAGSGLLLAAVLVLVARPLAVLVSLWPFGYRWQELVLISWVGLRGAVPIVLATYPGMLGYGEHPELFDVVFFVVLLSVLVQGTALAPLARALGLAQAPPREPSVSLDIAALREIDAEIVDLHVGPDSPAAGRTLRELEFPPDAAVALVARGRQIVPPRGHTRIEVGDDVFVVLRPTGRRALDRLFGVDRRARERD